MKIRQIKRTAVFLAVWMLFSALLLSLPTQAASGRVLYTFTGEDAARAGYAEGTIEIRPEGNEPEGSYYVIYFADDDGVLNDYKPIASVAVTGKTVRFRLGRKTALPEEATQIAVFTSTSETVENPSWEDARIAVIPEEKRFDSGAEELRFASLSDLHFNYAYAEDKWHDILEYFKEIGLPLVAISGDYSESGGTDHFSCFKRQVDAVGYEGTIWTSIGNHDTGNVENWMDNFTAFGPTDTDKPYFYKIAPNGDVFIFLAQDELHGTGNSNTQDCFSASQLDWFEGVLREYAGTGVNIFVYEHANFLNWGAGDVIPGIYVQPLNITENHKNIVRLKSILDEYKELIFCTGHTHVAFSEQCNFSDMNGTTARTIHNSSTSQPRTVNAGKTGYVYNTNPINSEGYLCTVYENDIVYRGMDFYTKEYIPTACYILESVSGTHEECKDVTSIAVNAEKSVDTYALYSSPDTVNITVEATFADGSVKEVADPTVLLYGNTRAVWGQVQSVLPVQDAFTQDVTHLLVSWGGKSVFYPVKTVNSCRDINTRAWYFSAVRYSLRTGLMVGISSDKFGPNDPTSRAMVVATLYRLSGSPTVSGTLPYPDTKAKQWYANAVLWASQNNIVAGYDNGTFGPNDTVTREQFASILYRYANEIGLDTADTVPLSSFADAKSVGNWAKKAMQWAVASDLIQGSVRSGKTYLNPQGKTSRAETAAILMRFNETFFGE